MKYKHCYGSDRFFSAPDEMSGRHHSNRGRRGGRHGGRLFDYGELRLLILAMIAERPSHGYELIKSIEDRFGGSYSPSPGVIYPTLSWLDDMGYAAVETDGGRKLYSVTAEGEAFLLANRASIDALWSRTAEGCRGGRRDAPAQIVRAMENLKLAMRLRFREGAVDDAAVEKIAAALDQAAQAVERS